MARTQPQKKSLVDDAKAALAVCAGWNARLAARRITLFLEKRMGRCGMSIAQFGLMAQLAAAEDDTLGALAARTGLDQSTLSRNLRGLERAGLVEIGLVDKDLRRRVVWLTEKGARTLESALPIWRQAHSDLAELMAPELAVRLVHATQMLADG
jgi:DNA-binding MarR family transcriptional regulator